MAKGRGGRPKKSDGEQGTKHVRVMEDLAEMLRWIFHFEGGTVAQILDPMLRAQVTARYKQYEPQVKVIKAAEAAAEKTRARKAGES